MFPEGRQTRKHCFLAMFPEGGYTRKHCFLTMLPEGKQTRKHFFGRHGLQTLILPLIIPFYSLKNETKYLVLVATSGDTGSAVLQGFRDCENVAVMVLYPEQGISSIQRQQMTSMDAKNIKVLGVDGDFDFCQTAVKQIFTGWSKFYEGCECSFSSTLLDTHQLL